MILYRAAGILFGDMPVSFWKLEKKKLRLLNDSSSLISEIDICVPGQEKLGFFCFFLPDIVVDAFSHHILEFVGKIIFGDTQAASREAEMDKGSRIEA